MNIDATRALKWFLEPADLLEGALIILVGGKKLCKEIIGLGGA